MGQAFRNPLAQGFYTVPQAARLIRVGSPRRIYGWLRGYAGRDVGPLLERDYQPVGDNEELSFHDLMEVRFVEHFREAGVKAQSLRIAARALRDELRTKHPFASQKILLTADKADVFVKEVMRKAAEEADDVRLRSLTTNNYVMYETIRKLLLPGVEFDPTSELASRWRPIPDRFPKIVVDPRISRGQPAIPKGIPTETLFDTWRAENQDVDVVAYWYEIPSTDVLQAVKFEQALDEELQRRAA
jgi:uncharacterized protein (DUF433 family)